MSDEVDISSVFQRYRVSHHAVAMMFAAGLEPIEIERRTGFTRRRLAILWDDPTFQELIKYYMRREQEKFVAVIEEFQQLKTHNALVAQRQLRDKLEEADDHGVTLPTRELIAISTDGAKTINNTQINVNIGNAEALDRAIERSRKVNPSIKAQPPEPLLIEAQVVNAKQPVPVAERKSRPAPRPSFEGGFRRPKVA